MQNRRVYGHARTHARRRIHTCDGCLCALCLYVYARTSAQNDRTHTHIKRPRANIRNSLLLTLDKSSTRTNADTWRQRRRTLNAKVYVGWKEPNECHSIVRLVRTNANVCMCARISIYSAAAAAADTEQEDAKRSLWRASEYALPHSRILICNRALFPVRTKPKQMKR